MESDRLHLIQKRSYTSGFGPLSDDIRMLKPDFHAVLFSHVSTEANKVAHSLVGLLLGKTMCSLVVLIITEYMYSSFQLRSTW